MLAMACLGIYAVSLALNLSFSLPSSTLNGYDICGEYDETHGIILSGWHPFETRSHNNTSIVVGLIVPALSKVVSPLWVYKVALPCIFSFTPLLLLLAYRKTLSERMAFIGALFFAVLPATWREIPSIGKSMVAEPLAAITLLVVFSGMNKKLQMPLVAVLAVLTAQAHYTVGFMLLSWLGCMAIGESISQRKVSILFVPVGIATVGVILWFSFASGGIIFYHMFYSWVMYVDPLVGKITGLHWSSESMTVQVQVIAFYITLILMVFGCYYLLKHYRQIDMRLLAGMVISGVSVLGGVFLSKYTGFLSTVRWVQLGAFCLSPFFAFGVEQLWRWQKGWKAKAFS